MIGWSIVMMFLLFVGILGNVIILCKREEGTSLNYKGTDIVIYTCLLLWGIWELAKL